MSAEVSGQAGFWLCAAALGAALLFFYDLLRIFRRVVPHGARAIGAEDFFYWLIAGGLVFALLYHFNNGIIRWFVVFGLLVGMLLYYLTLGAVFVEWASRMLRRVLRVLHRFFAPLRALTAKLRVPFAAFVTMIRKNHKKVTNFLKKKLKRREKEGKMNGEKKAGVTGVEKEQEQRPQQTE